MQKILIVTHFLILSFLCNGQKDTDGNLCDKIVKKTTRSGQDFFITPSSGYISIIKTKYPGWDSYRFAASVKSDSLNQSKVGRFEIIFEDGTKFTKEKVTVNMSSEKNKYRYKTIFNLTEEELESIIFSKKIVSYSLNGISYSMKSEKLTKLVQYAECISSK